MEVIIVMRHFHEIWWRPQHGQLFSGKFVFGAESKIWLSLDVELYNTRNIGLVSFDARIKCAATGTNMC